MTSPPATTAARGVGLWAGLIASVLIFIGAMGWHYQWFTPQAGRHAPVPASLGEKDEWFGIYQNAEKIGYSHRRLTPVDNGYRIADDTLMRINAMGLVQEVSLVTGATLNTDLSLRRFDMRLSSSRFSFRAKGQVTEDGVALTIDGRRLTVPLKTPVYLTNTVVDAAANLTPSPGNSMTVSVFDPATLSQRPANIRYEGEETLTVNGGPAPVRRLSVEFAGAVQHVWTDGSGRVVKERGLLGLTLLAETAETARQGISQTPAQDLTRLASVPVTGGLADPERLQRLSLKITGLPEGLDIDGGRQKRIGDQVVIQKEPATGTGAAPPPSPAFLAPTPLVQSDAPAIVAAARTVTDGAATDADKARRLVGWVHGHLRKQPVLSVPNALEILEQRVGDCNEHAILLAALGRAAGIPTRIEAGLVFMNGGFYYHAWNAFYLGTWVTADAIFDQMPADVSHLRLIIGGLARQVDLMGVIGRIAITVEDTVYD
jgi:transglutaminase-like putative cysteine protease